MSCVAKDLSLDFATPRTALRKLGKKANGPLPADRALFNTDDCDVDAPPSSHHCCSASSPVPVMRRGKGCYLGTASSPSFSSGGHRDHTNNSAGGSSVVLEDGSVTPSFLRTSRSGTEGLSLSNSRSVGAVGGNISRGYTSLRVGVPSVESHQGDHDYHQDRLMHCRPSASPQIRIVTATPLTAAAKKKSLSKQNTHGNKKAPHTSATEAFSPPPSSSLRRSLSPSSAVTSSRNHDEALLTRTNHHPHRSSDAHAPTTSPFRTRSPLPSSTTAANVNATPARRRAAAADGIGVRVSSAPSPSRHDNDSHHYKNQYHRSQNVSPQRRHISPTSRSATATTTAKASAAVTGASSFTRTMASPSPARFNHRTPATTSVVTSTPYVSASPAFRLRLSIEKEYNDDDDDDDASSSSSPPPQPLLSGNDPFVSVPTAAYHSRVQSYHESTPNCGALVVDAPALLPPSSHHHVRFNSSASDNKKKAEGDNEKEKERGLFTLVSPLGAENEGEGAEKRKRATTVASTLSAASSSSSTARCLTATTNASASSSSSSSSSPSAVYSGVVSSPPTLRLGGSSGAVSSSTFVARPPPPAASSSSLSSSSAGLRPSPPPSFCSSSEPIHLAGGVDGASLSSSSSSSQPRQPSVGSSGVHGGPPPGTFVRSFVPKPPPPRASS